MLGNVCLLYQCTLQVVGRDADGAVGVLPLNLSHCPAGSSSSSTGGNAGASSSSSGDATGEH